MLNPCCSAEPPTPSDDTTPPLQSELGAGMDETATATPQELEDGLGEPFGAEEGTDFEGVANAMSVELPGAREVSVESDAEAVADAPTDDRQMITTVFQEGPLGVNIRRRPADGKVFVFDIVRDSQATALDVCEGDELWALGETVLGEQYIDKEGWEGLVQYIKSSARPLQVTWHRPPMGREPLPGVGMADSPEVEEDPEPRSADYLVLQEALCKLAKKGVPREGPQPFQYRSLLKEGRRLLKRGDLLTQGASALWMKTYSKRHVFLTSDTLIVTTPVVRGETGSPTSGSSSSGSGKGSSDDVLYQVDHVIDLQVCKLRSDGRSFGLGDGASPPSAASVISSFGAAVGSALQKQAQPPADCAFQVVYPGGVLQFSANSSQAKEVWVLNLFLAVCACVDDGGRRLGWQHMYMLGTMHSAVLTHDEMQVRELIALCDAGQLEFSSCIDAVDEDGYTPLHYACMLRVPGIIRALHEAAADVTAVDNYGFTPLHWAAMQLDEASLGVLCAHLFELDFYDREGRTPLYMLCVQGRNIHGQTDASVLRNCVATMLTRQPNVNIIDTRGLCVLHYLAASWHYEAMELMLKAGAEVNMRGGAGDNLAQPLHLACLASPLKLAEGEGSRIMNGKDKHQRSHASTSTAPTASLSTSSSAAALGTPDKPYQYPQYEKLHHPYGCSTLKALLKAGARPNAKDSKGRSALLILAEPGREDLWDQLEMTDAVAALVSFGARFDDSAPLQALRGRLLAVDVGALTERWQSLPVIDGDPLNLTLNHFQPLDTGAGTGIEHAYPDSAEKKVKGVLAADRCVLCSVQYGIFKRPHHCRLCGVGCCDDCSKRRVLIDAAQVRCCDGCYNRAMDLQEHDQRRDLTSRLDPALRTQQARESNDASNRSKLFGEAAMASAASATAGPNGANERTRVQAPEGKASQTMAVLSETHERLMERGEKLSRAAERSEEMANQANEFANMARLLNEQQKNRWF
mmetsp:Transcript_35397/g.77942  ORF Transcript_35397/g.77942 Transcript_35397/m.77942 type:complete len:975 (-) Transcript_35397:66-2990(-)